MIVARQFIAWNTPKKGEPARRGGVSWATPHIRRPWSKNVLSTESYRSLRDGFFVWHTPGNKLPGYDHSVPPGQKTLNACPRIRRRITPNLRGRGRRRERGRGPALRDDMLRVYHPANLPQFPYVQIALPPHRTVKSLIRRLR